MNERRHIISFLRFAQLLTLMRHFLFRRLIAILLLAAHVVTGTSALPALTALAASIEGGHTVIVAQTEHGTQIFLHHRQGEYTPKVADHTSELARMIVRLCKTSGCGDHQLSSERLSSSFNEESEEHPRIKKQVPSAQMTVCYSPRLLSVRVIRTDGHRSYVARLCSMKAMLGSVRMMV
jgi:hypothetical protein